MFGKHYVIFRISVPVGQIYEKKLPFKHFITYLYVTSDVMRMPHFTLMTAGSTSFNKAFAALIRRHIELRLGCSPNFFIHLYKPECEILLNTLNASLIKNWKSLIPSQISASIFSFFIAYLTEIFLQPFLNRDTICKGTEKVSDLLPNTVSKRKSHVRSKFL